MHWQISRIRLGMEWPAIFTAIFLGATAAVSCVDAQTAAAQKPAAAATAAPATSDLDAVVELVKGGMSEQLIVKTIQRGGQSYSLTPSDMRKLQKAGVSNAIIEALLDPTPPAKAPAANAVDVPGSRQNLVAAPAGTPADAATPEAAPTKKEEKEKKKSMFSGWKDQFQETMKKTVDSSKSTVDHSVSNTLQGAQDTANQRIQSTQDKVDAKTAAVTAKAQIPASKPATTAPAPATPAPATPVATTRPAPPVTPAPQPVRPRVVAKRNPSTATSTSPAAAAATSK